MGYGAVEVMRDMGYEGFECTSAVANGNHFYIYGNNQCNYLVTGLDFL